MAPWRQARKKPDGRKQNRQQRGRRASLPGSWGMAWQGAESAFPGAAPPGPRAPRTCSAWRQHILQAERIVGSRGARLMVTVSLLALDKERTRHDGRARSPLCSKGPWSRRHPTVTPSSCSAPARQRPARGEPGGNAGQHAPSPGLDSRAEIELGPGRSEEGPREEGPGPAAPRSPGGTRTGGASPPLPTPQLSRNTGPEAGAQASSFCSAHSPRLLPFPSKTPAIKLFEEPESLPRQLLQFDHSLSAWLCFRTGEEVGDPWINLESEDVSVVRDLKEARSQALRELATDWSEKRAEAGRTRQAEG